MRLVEPFVVTATEVQDVLTFWVVVGGSGLG